jgi:hypothetical protein
MIHRDVLSHYWQITKHRAQMGLESAKSILSILAGWTWRQVVRRLNKHCLRVRVYWLANWRRKFDGPEEWRKIASAKKMLLPGTPVPIGMFHYTY